ncbi:MAG: diaminopimelate epimerase, partial [Solirubrobacteraceae bacterium]|nr:diaminopimelate epimerase [Solirubrobacteraceae bacterium]
RWQALGNDYLIAEAAKLPWPVTPERVRILCNRHTGVGGDGLLVLSPSEQRGFVAKLEIFNPDGSEAELSGNGAREAIMYLRHRGWTDADQFSIETIAGELRPTITGATSCIVDMGRAKTSSPDFPGGGPEGIGELESAGHKWRFQHVKIGNPQCSIRVGSVEALQGLDLSAIGPGIEHHTLFPNRTNVSWYAQLAPNRIRARIFERGVGETMSSGTGATGAAVAHVIHGGDSPVIVELDGGELTVTVDESMHVDLAGWAEPVGRVELSDVFAARLAAVE